MEQPLTYNEKNAIYQQRHRQKLRDELKDEKYKEKRRLEMQVYRQKVKAKDAELNPPKKPVARPTFNAKDFMEVPKQGRPTKKSKVSDEIVPLHIQKNTVAGEGTIKQYISQLNTISNLIIKKPLSRDANTFLTKLLSGKMDKPEAVVQVLTNNYLGAFLKFPKLEATIEALHEKYPKAMTFRAYINAMVVVVARVPAFKKEYNLLSKINVKYAKDYQTERSKNEIDAKDVGKLIKFDEATIQENIKKIKSPMDQVIYALCMYLNRRLEIRLLKIASSNSSITENLLVVDKNNMPVEAVFNEYKTSDKFGQQVVAIPESIKELIGDYIENNDIHLGMYLLGQQNDKRKEIGQGNFSKKIKDIFESVYGEAITNNWIRMSKATEQSGKYLEAFKAFQDQAQAQAHSASTHTQYIKTKVKSS